MNNEYGYRPGNSPSPYTSIVDKLRTVMETVAIARNITASKENYYLYGKTHDLNVLKEKLNHFKDLLSSASQGAGLYHSTLTQYNQLEKDYISDLNDIFYDFANETVGDYVYNNYPKNTNKKYDELTADDEMAFYLEKNYRLNKDEINGIMQDSATLRNYLYTKNPALKLRINNLDRQYAGQRNTLESSLNQYKPFVDNYGRIFEESMYGLNDPNSFGNYYVGKGNNTGSKLLSKTNKGIKPFNENYVFKLFSETDEGINPLNENYVFKLFSETDKDHSSNGPHALKPPSEEHKGSSTAGAPFVDTPRENISTEGVSPRENISTEGVSLFNIQKSVEPPSSTERINISNTPAPADTISVVNSQRDTSIEGVPPIYIKSLVNPKNFTTLKPKAPAPIVRPIYIPNPVPPINSPYASLTYTDKGDTNPSKENYVFNHVDEIIQGVKKKRDTNPFKENNVFNLFSEIDDKDHTLESYLPKSLSPAFFKPLSETDKGSSPSTERIDIPNTPAPADTISVGNPQRVKKKDYRTVTRVPADTISVGNPQINIPTGRPLFYTQNSAKSKNPSRAPLTYTDMGDKEYKKYKKLSNPIIEELIVKYAGIGGFDPNILRTIITRESSWDKEAKGKAGEYGLTQIMPSTWRSLNKQMGVNWNNGEWKDPEKNIAVASHFISTLVKKYQGNLLKVFGAYNRGEPEMDNFLTKGKDFSKSGRAYINGSLSLYYRLKNNN